MRSANKKRFGRGLQLGQREDRPLLDQDERQGLVGPQRSAGEAQDVPERAEEVAQEVRERPALHEEDGAARVRRFGQLRRESFVHRQTVGRTS